MYLLKYILKRLCLVMFTFIIIISTCFVLIKLLPIPDDVQLGQDPELLRARLEARGWYDPIPKQMFDYVKRIVTEGDFGIGTTMPEYRNRNVWDAFVECLPPTVVINISSSLIAVPIGLALGIFAALKKNKWQDYTISTLIMVVVSVPSYVYAFLIQYIICFRLGWFDLTVNPVGPGQSYLDGDVYTSLLPAVFSLCFGSIAGYCRFSRAELTEVLTSDFMLLARTKGLTRRHATVRHGLKNAMVPIFPSIVGEFITVMMGSLVIEKIFAVPGVGGLYLASITVMDYDFFMLLSSFYCLIGLLASIVIDISYGVIDPRIRMGAK